MNADNRLLAFSLWSIAIVATGDALNVGVYTQGKSPLTLGPHVGGLVVLAVLGWWLWSRPASADKQSVVQ